MLSFSMCCIGVLLPIGAIPREISLDPGPETVGSKSKLTLDCIWAVAQVKSQRKTDQEELGLQNSEVQLKPSSQYRVKLKKREVVTWLYPFAKKEETWMYLNVVHVK